MLWLAQDKHSGAAPDGLKSYYIKTAVLWLAQDKLQRFLADRHIRRPHGTGPARGLSNSSLHVAMSFHMCQGHHMNVCHKNSLGG